MTEDEPVGTLAEEAAKLFVAIHGMTGQRPARAPSAGEQRPDEQQADDEPHERDVHHHEHVSQPSDECRWCPLCQLARLARATSPDVREHLEQAALSVALAIKGLLEESEGTARRATPLEKIDLTEE